MILGVALLPVAIWAYLLIGRGWFWLCRERDDDARLERAAVASNRHREEAEARRGGPGAAGRLTIPGLLRRSAPRNDAPDVWPSVVAIIPARDEADMIARSVGSLLRQDYPGPFSVIVVDDQSADGTALVALAAASEAQAVDRLRIVAGTGPPPGWTGKLSAMRQGLAEVEAGLGHDKLWSTAEALTPTLSPRERGRDGASPSPPGRRWPEGPDEGLPRDSTPNRFGLAPEFVLFTDADIAYTPHVLSRLIEIARRNNSVLTSLMVKLNCESAAERWLAPAFVFFFQMLYPFAWVNDPRRATAAAAGGCMLVKREALHAAGGLEAVRGALIDDCALGALMKRQGPIWLGLTESVDSLRAYPSFADFRGMVARSAFAELRYSPWRLAGAIGGMALVYIAPPLFAIFARGAAEAAGALAWAMMALALTPTLKLYRRPLIGALALPAIAAAYVAFTFDSALQYWRGRGGYWKGRVQAPVRETGRA
jgi:Glycosyl transferase family 21/Glycosyl transferase family 2